MMRKVTAFIFFIILFLSFTVKADWWFYQPAPQSNSQQGDNAGVIIGIAIIVIIFFVLALAVGYRMQEKQNSNKEGQRYKDTKSTFCPNCGKKIEGTSFCPNCGNKI